MTGDPPRLPPDRPGGSPRAAPANPLWGGRFARGPAEIMQAINASVDFDRRLAQHDLQASRAHADMLAATGILNAEDAAAIISGLDRIEAEMADGRFVFKAALEDVHMNVEARLADLVGEPAGRLHTARSRNDQVATDFRLWVREALDRTDRAVATLQTRLIDRAEAEAATPMPGFTHLQAAQPVTFGHHLLAYVEMLGRDRGRLADARRRTNECPLGSAALAGTSFPIDRERTAAALGFDRPTANSLDAVSDRDFALEYLAAAAILATHLSRLAEELVLWTSDRFAFVVLSDALTTGSSIMPQKRNPDAAELVRAKSGRVFGHLLGLLTTLKGLPLAYAKDMQEDKEPVFDTDDTLMLCLAAMTGMIADMTVNHRAMAEALATGHPTATDLADWLVQHLGLPFRRAHQITGALVQQADRHGLALADLDLAEMQAVEPRITDAVRAVLTPAASVASRTSYGGTAPERVRQAVAEARTRFALPERESGQ